MRISAHAITITLVACFVAAHAHGYGSAVGVESQAEGVRSAAEGTSLPPRRGQPLSLDQEKERLDRETHSAYLEFVFTRNREGQDSPATKAARERFDKLDQERRAILKRLGL